MIQIIWLVQCIDWVGNMMTRVAMHVAVASLTQIQIESSESLRDMSKHRRLWDIAESNNGWNNSFN